VQSHASDSSWFRGGVRIYLLIHRHPVHEVVECL
jgi:hypothetical protein